MLRVDHHAHAARGDTYLWIGPDGGSWSAAADWRDETTGTVGVSAPGPRDAVTIDGPGSSTLLVTGGGAAASLTVANSVSLAGDYQFGLLDVAGSLGLGPAQTIGVAHVSVRTVRVEAAGSLSLQRTDLTVSGAATLDGSLSVTSESEMQTGNLVLSAAAGELGPTLLVDGTSILEIGRAGGAAVGKLTVDAGYTFSASGNVIANIVDNGVIVVNGGLNALTDIAGSGQLRIGTGSSLALAGVATGVTIDFAGLGATLVVFGFPATNPASPNSISPQAPLVGFASGDAIDFATTPLVSAVASAIPGGESVVLSDASGHVVDTLTVEGADGSDAYLLLPDGHGGTLVLIAPASPGAGAAPPGTSTHDKYSWTGAIDTDWDTAGNWMDVTTGGTATVPPGKSDDVTIAPTSNGALVTGVGQAHTLTLASGVILDGRFGTSTLAVTGAATVAGLACAVSAATIDAVAGSSLLVDGASLDAGSSLGGAWELLGGAKVQIGTVDILDGLSIDSTSSFEIGTAGGAAAGALTVDAGATLSGIAYVSSNVVDNGTILSPLSDQFRGSLSGTGTVVIGPGAYFEVENAISGVTFDFAGAGAVLDQSFSNAASQVSLSGFGPGTFLFLSSNYYTPITRASYVAGGTDRGTLTLSNTAGVAVESFILLGDYSGDSFIAQPLPGGEMSAITLLPPVDPHTKPAAGTSSQDSYVWTGSQLGGAWGSVGNWQDTTSGGAAVVPPGLHDSVQIEAPVQIDPFGPVAPLLVTGAGQAQSISTGGGDVILDGRFSATTINAGVLTVAGLGSHVAAGTLNVQGTLTVDGASAGAGTADVEGEAIVRNGGFLSATSLALYGEIVVDAISRLRIGAAAVPVQKGALTVEAGATLSANGTLDAAVVDNGALAAQSLTISGAVSGHGEIVAGGNLLQIAAGVGNGIEFVFAASDATLAFGDAPDMHAVVSGFAVGDTIGLEDIATASSAIYSYLGNGQGKLVLSDAAGQTVDSLRLAGDYRGASFVVSNAGYGDTVILTSSGTSGSHAF